MIPEKRLSIIVPSYNDERIAQSIASIRHFDDLRCSRIIVVDGGSRPELRDRISRLLTDDDLFLCGPDRGIFDALNKGLDHSATEYIGWLGSDDIFTGQILASDVVRALQTHDVFVTNHAMVSGNSVRRVTHSLPSRLGLVKFGFNNPHFATFGRADLLKSERFRVDLLGADIDYFIRIFGKRPSVATSSAISVLANEGGFSTASGRKIVSINLQLFQVYRQHSNSAIVASFALFNKAAYKVCTSLYYRVFRKPAASLVASVPLMSDDRGPQSSAPTTSV